VDLFGKAIEVDDEEGTQEEGDQGEGEGEDGEPEDDFNAAWEVLDLARAIYDKQVTDDADDEVKLKLADTYIALGDVSLETGNAIFPLYEKSCSSLRRKVRPSHFRLRSWSQA
jgi:HAT1-interacting factor 1